MRWPLAGARFRKYYRFTHCWATPFKLGHRGHFSPNSQTPPPHHIQTNAGSARREESLTTRTLLQRVKINPLFSCFFFHETKWMFYWHGNYTHRQTHRREYTVQFPGLLFPGYCQFFFVFHIPSRHNSPLFFFSLIPLPLDRGAWGARKLGAGKTTVAVLGAS